MIGGFGFRVEQTAESTRFETADVASVLRDHKDWQLRWDGGIGAQQFAGFPS